MVSRCEVCEGIENLLCCASLDQPELMFCPEHYIEHVKDSHHGIPLPGCISLEDAARVSEERAPADSGQNDE